MDLQQAERWQLAERSLGKKYRKEIWNPFIEAVKRYELIEPGDKIAVCVSGGKDSMMLAVLMRMLRRFTEVPFEVVNLVMDPGYTPENRKKLEENAALLQVPITVFETDIFRVANKTEKSPCYLCARMRRGHLYAKAKELGCNKIALGHHFSDVIETTVMAMFYSSQLQGMMPKVKSLNFEGMELIRPLYCVNEKDIVAWARYNGLSFLQCACRFTEQFGDEAHQGASKRQEVKELIRTLKQKDPDIEKSIFSAIHNVCLDTFPAYKTKGELHSFLERYDETE
ncbi:MAG: tRNA 2-thiocytidine biosynthesis protein TtcA [Clostridia bacterium]|nr:tRNA 2-thiocytidine biosynthesis protein TtcA [Clostridia bacterium]